MALTLNQHVLKKIKFHRVVSLLIYMAVNKDIAHDEYSFHKKFSLHLSIKFYACLSD